MKNYISRLEGGRKLILIGSKFQEGEENMHQLPINRQYQYYGDLFTLILLDHKYQDLSLESFENFWSLYLNMDESESQDEIYSSDDNIEEQLPDEEEEMVLEDYGDKNEESRRRKTEKKRNL